MKTERVAAQGDPLNRKLRSEFQPCANHTLLDAYSKSKKKNLSDNDRIAFRMDLENPLGEMFLGDAFCETLTFPAPKPKRLAEA